MTTTDDLDLAAIEARLVTVTDGSWGLEHRSTGVVIWAFGGDGGKEWCEPVAHSSSEANALFIQHARTDIPALLTALRAARAERDRYREVLERIRDSRLLPANELRDAICDHCGGNATLALMLGPVDGKYYELHSPNHCCGIAQAALTETESVPDKEE